jgi:protease IV
MKHHWFSSERILIMTRKGAVFLIGVLLLSAAGCVSPKVKLFTDATDPLQEFTLEGEGREKILLIPVKGVISDHGRKGMFRTEPSMVQDIVSQLRLAEKDSYVRAVLMTIDSPGGTVTASDLLYHEIMEFKKRTGAKVTAVMMNLATSGGYYMALSADHVMAHPTSVTGSIGVVFMRPKIYGLMDKIGVEVSANTSGKNKDMGSPFREATETEVAIFQELTDRLGMSFIDLVAKHRQIKPEILSEISSGRIYLAREAMDKGLIDEVGYLSDAVDRTRQVAALPENSRLVVYRRNEYPDDNIYNTHALSSRGHLSLIDLGLPDLTVMTQPGFYYLWPGGMDCE